MQIYSTSFYKIWRKVAHGSWRKLLVTSGESVLGNGNANIQLKISAEVQCHFWPKHDRRKKHSERRKHCTLAVVRRSQNFFTPPQTPFPGARTGPNLISWRWSLHLPIEPVWWRWMHTILNYRGNRPTNTHKQTHRQDRLQYTVSLSLERSINILGKHSHS